MKRRVVLPLLVGSSLVLTFGCASPASDITTVRVGGPVGAAVTGSYVQNGYRVPISGTLPMTFTHEQLDELEIRKSSPEQTLRMAAQNDFGAWHSEAYSTASPDVQGFRVVVHNGIVIEKIK